MTFTLASIIFISLFVLLSLTNCTKLKYYKQTRLFTKPFIIPTLTTSYLLLLNANTLTHMNQSTFIIAMCFYTLGDLCILYTNKIRIFGFGILCFVIGHLLYASFFFSLPIRHSLIATLVCILALIPATTLLWRKIQRTDDPLSRWMYYYSFPMCLIIIAVASTFNFSTFLISLLTLIGSLFFITSDALIGFRGTGQPTPKGEVVMITYTLGQALLATGALLLQTAP